MGCIRWQQADFRLHDRLQRLCAGEVPVLVARSPLRRLALEAFSDR